MLTSHQPKQTLVNLGLKLLRAMVSLIVSLTFYNTMETFHHELCVQVVYAKCNACIFMMTALFCDSCIHNVLASVTYQLIHLDREHIPWFITSALVSVVDIVRVITLIS